MSVHYLSEASSEPLQTSKLKLFTKIVTDFWQLTIFAKISILHVLQGSECIFLRFSGQLFSKHLCFLIFLDSIFWNVVSNNA